MEINLSNFIQIQIVRFYNWFGIHCFQDRANWNFAWNFLIYFKSRSEMIIFTILSESKINNHFSKITIKSSVLLLYGICFHVAFYTNPMRIAILYEHHFFQFQTYFEDFKVLSLDLRVLRKRYLILVCCLRECHKEVYFFM